MTESLTRIEHDIEETRSRLHDTIDRIQDKLTVPGIVDEVMGSSGMPRFQTTFDQALVIVRRNPIPVLVLAAGIGWVLHRMGRDKAAARAALVDGTALEVPVIKDRRARSYDPDLPAAHPPSSLLESGRMNVRA